MKSILGIFIIIFGLVLFAPSALVTFLCIFKYKPGCELGVPLLTFGLFAGFCLILVGCFLLKTTSESKGNLEEVTKTKMFDFTK